MGDTNFGKGTGTVAERECTDEGDGFLVAIAGKWVKGNLKGWDFVTDKLRTPRVLKWSKIRGFDGLKEYVAAEFGVNPREAVVEISYWWEDILAELYGNGTAPEYLISENEYIMLKSLHKGGKNPNIYVTFREKVDEELVDGRRKEVICLEGVRESGCGGGSGPTESEEDELIVKEAERIEAAIREAEAGVCRSRENDVHIEEEIAREEEEEHLTNFTSVGSNVPNDEEENVNGEREEINVNTEEGDHLNEGAEEEVDEEDELVETESGEYEWDYWNDLVLNDGNSHSDSDEDGGEAGGIGPRSSGRSSGSVERSVNQVSHGGAGCGSSRNNSRNDPEDGDFVDDPSMYTSTSRCGYDFERVDDGIRIETPAKEREEEHNGHSHSCEDDDFVANPPKVASKRNVGINDDEVVDITRRASSTRKVIGNEDVDFVNHPGTALRRNSEINEDDDFVVNPPKGAPKRNGRMNDDEYVDVPCDDDFVYDPPNHVSTRNSNTVDEDDFVDPLQE